MDNLAESNTISMMTLHINLFNVQIWNKILWQMAEENKLSNDITLKNLLDLSHVVKN